MAILKIKQPNGSWAIVGDTSETIKFTEQQLTDEQKQQTCDNIGAISALRGEYIDSLDFIYSNDSWNHYPAGNYCGTSFQDINGEIITSWVLKGIELPFLDQYLQYLFTEGNQYVRSIINKEVVVKPQFRSSTKEVGDNMVNIEAIIHADITYEN